jgi:hypothetical protein
MSLLQTETAKRLAEAIHSLSFPHGEPVALLHMALDLIQIELDRPAGIFLKRGNREFESAANCGLEIKTELAPVTSGCDILGTVSTARGAWETEQDCRTRLLDAWQLISLIFQELGNKRAPFGIGEPFIDFLSKGLGMAQDQLRADAAGWLGSPVDDASGQRLGNLFSRVFAGIQGRTLNLKGFMRQGEATPSDGLRVLFCHRVIDANGIAAWSPHTFDGQSGWLRTTLESAVPLAGSVEVAELIEQAFPHLPAHCESGVAGWAISDQGVTPLRALVLPIHVQGIAWMAMVALFDERELLPQGLTRRAWAKSIYSNLFPQFIAEIRNLADRSFLDGVADIALGARKERVIGAKELEQALSPLYRIFPHRRLQFKGDARDFLGEWRKSDRRSELVSFEGLAEVIDYDLLGKDRVCEALNIAADRYSTYQVQRQRGEGGAYFNIAHNLKSIIETSDWERSANAIAPYGEKLLKGGKLTLDARLVNAIRTADRSLSVAPMIAGLAQVGLLHGAYDGEVDWQKYDNWLPAGCRLPEQLALQPYAEVLRQIASMVCHGQGCDEDCLEVSWCDGINPPVHLPQGFAPPIRTGSVELPPFARGTKVVYPIFFALFEPLFNAAKALKTASDKLGSHPDGPGLRIMVRPSQDDACELCVTITNRSLREINGDVSGLADARRLVAGLNLVEYGSLEARQVGNHYLVSLSLQLRPLELARPILEARDTRNV